MNRFLLLILLLPFAGNAQTALIFHKSHSGSATSFASTRFGNFGEPPEMRIPYMSANSLFQKLNDSVVLLRTTVNGTMNWDTMYNHPILSNPSITVDSLQKLYGEKAVFINFPKQPEYTPPPGQEHLPPLGIPDEHGKKHNKKHRKEKHSGSLWLLLIGGGTFFGYGMLVRATRQRIVKPTHA